MKYKNVTRTIDEYKDIIHLPHKQSKTRPHMAIHDRAAQFSPFAAVTGHDAAIAETARLTDSWVELDEMERDLLGLKVNGLMLRIDEHPAIKITYFQPDRRKSGGTYVQKCGELKKIDEYERLLVFMDGTEVLLERITAIDEE